MGRRVDKAVEWGGAAWSDQVQRGLTWLGDVAGLTILEVGTRFGGMAVHLAELGAEVTGVDVDAGALDIARRRAEDAGLSSRVELRTYSGRPADLPTGFDVVFTKSTLVLMAPLDEAFAAIRRSLVEGGRLVAVENARGPWPFHMARLTRRRSLHPHGADYFTRRTIEIASRHLEPRHVRWTVFPPTVLLCAVRAPAEAEPVVPLTGTGTDP